MNTHSPCEFTFLNTDPTSCDALLIQDKFKLLSVCCTKLFQTFKLHVDL